MTRGEAEKIFLPVVLSDDTGVVKMTSREIQTFRVLVGMILKDMEKDNKELWLRASNYAIEYHEPYAIIRNLDTSRYKRFTLEENGSLTETTEGKSRIDNHEP